MPTEQQKKEYLACINFRGKNEINFRTLKKIVEGHIFTFPYETINVHNSLLDTKPSLRTSLDFNTLFSKFVKRRRGGHCAEINTFLQVMLCSFGFEVKSILAEDTYLNENVPVGSRDKHAVGIVTLDDEEFLVDAAFGSLGMLSPVPLKMGEYLQFSEKFKLNASNDYPFEFQVWRDKWVSLMGFDKNEAKKKDFQEINEVNHSPFHLSSYFRNLFICTKPFKINKTQNGRFKIHNDKFMIFRKGKLFHQRMITGQEDFHRIMEKFFKIQLKPKEHIRFTELDMKANLIGIHYAPVLHRYPTRKKQEYIAIARDVGKDLSQSTPILAPRLRRTTKRVG